jgi:regulator of protease activity HflC (stomatin/prohibitin superfamily)
MFTGLTVVLVVTLVLVAKTFMVVHAHESVVKERLGKFAGVLKPGFHFMVPIMDRAAYRLEMREQVLDVPAQSCITKDNIQVEVDGLVYLKVMDAQRAAYGIGDYKAASVNLAQTTMRAEIGKLALDDTFSERDSINGNIVREIDKASSPWGIKMIRYEIRNITPSRRVIETMEKQMEAEREKRASITVSQGQKEANVLISEGRRTEAVNLSEGEKQRRINESSGQATEIRLLAEAQAEGLRLVANATSKPGGHLAVRTQLVEAYLNELGKVLEVANVTVMPAEAAQVKATLEGLSRVLSQVPRNPNAPKA